ncbi:pyroglutamyl-peptidase I [Pseudoxanthomonas sp. PXM04]|uniref:pyroglutamyl-peptidase I family protein n=1 Tax=Pseudoxanthomonas sp. PXM04 TaxID=2769297 RepID=UPI00177B3A48|nr:pyroglutamyl-peptidase I [Pseudoxanthomonas sp. PXM04]MBD9378871.1 pyroglutamyl-peptidase I [Pseudoxanthomonas sp. PXM04]
MPRLSRKPILITGFEPFGSATTNPSWEAASALDGIRVHGRKVIARCLPVTFAGAPRRLKALLAEHDPGVVLCTGVDNFRSVVCLEQVAINLANAQSVDNDGYRPIDAPLSKRGAAAYFATVPLRAMLEGLQALECPADISLSAGTYVCNATFYHLMRALKRRNGARGGFIHVPMPRPEPIEMPWGGSYPALPLSLIVAGLRRCVEIASEPDVSSP